MEYLTLNNGVRMPLVGFGTWDVRGVEGKRAILTALEVGYRLIDTAQKYGNERIVGEAVRESGIPREDIFVTTKLDSRSAGYKGAKEGIERSLRELGIGYIDLLLVHGHYPTAPEMYRAFEEAYETGKVKAIGISNFGVEDYDNLLRHCRIIPAVNQTESHVYFPQLELKGYLEKHGTLMQSYSSFTEGRKNIFSEPILVNIASKYGRTSAQVALRFLTQQGIPVIPKSVHRERMEENLNSLDFTLSREDLEEIATLDGGKSLLGWC